MRKTSPTKKQATPKPKKQAAIVQVNAAPAAPWLLNTEEVTIVKNNICKGASDQELAFCLTVARRYKLDPFRQQIWFVSRWDKNADNGKNGKGANVWTPQVGINGLLFAAARDHKPVFGSVSLPEFGPMVSVSSEYKNLKAPEWARVKVWKKGESEPTEAEAWWEEYAPADLTKAPFWRKMPRRMLGKCATALAIRQAYPDLGGLYIPEEMERMGEDVTETGRRIIEEGHIEPSREVTQEDLVKYESISITPLEDGRALLAGDSGLSIIKTEIAQEELTELGIVRNAKSKTVHIPMGNVFKFIDRAKKCNVTATLVESQAQNQEPVQGTLI